MTTLTIEIPDEVSENVVNILKTKDVTIKLQPKILDDLTVEDYRKNFIHRSEKMKSAAAKYV